GFVVLPLLLLGLFQTVAIGFPRLHHFLCLPEFWRRGAAIVFGSCLCLGFLSQVPYARERILAALLMVMLLCLIGRIWLSSPGLMLPYLLVAIVGCTLFIFELPILAETRRPNPLADWGDDTTFQYLLAKSPPFIGPGGRLRPSVRCRMSRPPWDDRLGVW